MIPSSVDVLGSTSASKTRAYSNSKQVGREHLGVAAENVTLVDEFDVSGFDEIVLLFPRDIRSGRVLAPLLEELTDN